MISKQLNHTVTLFSSMPKYHRIGVIILCGALISVGLSRKSTEDSNIPSSSSSILATTAHAASLQNNTAPLVEQAPLSPITEHTTDAIAAVEQALQTQPEQSTQVFIEETVKDGDFLETVFKRAKVNSKYMYHLLHNHPKAKSLAKIYPGHKLLFVLDSDGKLAELHHIEDELHKQVFARTDDGYEHSTIALEPEVRLVRTSGTITHSLYAAAKEANLEDKLTMSLADIFGWDVDFALDIRENDSFVVVYEERYLADKYLGLSLIHI